MWRREVLVRIMALRIASSLRMHAMSGAFLGFPVATRHQSLIGGIYPRTWPEFDRRA